MALVKKTLYYDIGKKKYEGEIKDGKYHGQGTLFFYSYDDIIKYEGEFKDGKYHGQGKLFYYYYKDYKAKRRQYEGEFENGKYHGFIHLHDLLKEGII